jgi:hypothetical protein
MPQLLEEEPDVVFQHDGELPHVHNEVTTFVSCLTVGSAERICILAASFPRSDPLYFFSWGYIKDQVYVLRLSITLKSLNNNTNVHREVIESVWQKTEYHPDVYRITNGKQTEFYCAPEHSAFPSIGITFLYVFQFLLKNI